MQNQSTTHVSNSQITPSNTYHSTPDLDTPLHVHIEHSVRQYFMKLDGEQPHNLYETLLAEVEKPLLSVVLEHTSGNQTKTAKILGLNRGTLRKKLALYGLI